MQADLTAGAGEREWRGWWIRGGGYGGDGDGNGNGDGDGERRHEPTTPSRTRTSDWRQRHDSESDDRGVDEDDPTAATTRQTRATRLSRRIGTQA